MFLLWQINVSAEWSWWRAVFFFWLTWVHHSNQSTQRLGSPAAVEARVDIQTEDVVDVVQKLLLYQQLDELHPSSRDLLPAFRTGNWTHCQLNGDEEEEEIRVLVDGTCATFMHNSIICSPVCGQPFWLEVPPLAGRWTHICAHQNQRRSAALPSPGSFSGTWCTYPECHKSVQTYHAVGGVHTTLLSY